MWTFVCIAPSLISAQTLHRHNKYEVQSQNALVCIFNDLFCFVGTLYLLTLLCVRIFQNKRVYLGHKNMKDDLIVLQTVFISRFYKDNHWPAAGFKQIFKLGSDSSQYCNIIRPQSLNSLSVPLPLQSVFVLRVTIK